MTTTPTGLMSPRAGAPTVRPDLRPSTSRSLPVGTVRPTGFAGALAAAQRSRAEPAGDAVSAATTATAAAATAASTAALRLPGTIGDLVAQAAQRYGVDPELIAAVAECESNFNPNAVSPAGARGLMQLMPATARGLGVTDPSDPRQNVLGGAKLLGQLLDRYGGDVSKALAAYNAGAGAVDAYGGIPPYAETRRYVPKVLAAMERYQRRT